MSKIPLTILNELLNYNSKSSDLNIDALPKTAKESTAPFALVRWEDPDWYNSFSRANTSVRCALEIKGDRDYDVLFSLKDELGSLTDLTWVMSSSFVTGIKPKTGDEIVDEHVLSYFKEGDATHAVLASIEDAYTYNDDIDDRFINSQAVSVTLIPDLTQERLDLLIDSLAVGSYRCKRHVHNAEIFNINIGRALESDLYSAKVKENLSLMVLDEHITSQLFDYIASPSIIPKMPNNVASVTYQFSNDDLNIMMELNDGRPVKLDLSSHDLGSLAQWTIYANKERYQKGLSSGVIANPILNADIKLGKT